MANAMINDTFRSSHPDLTLASLALNTSCDSEEAEECKLLRSLSSSRDINMKKEEGTATATATATAAEPSLVSEAAAAGGGASNGMKFSPLKDSSSGPVLSTRKKSVDFTIHHGDHEDLSTMATATGMQPPPNKRVKQLDPAWTPQQVVEAISTCICKHERLEAIEKARDCFDHDVQAIHDDEMASGADAALAKHLTFLVHLAHEQEQATPAHQNDLLSELSMTVDAMESLYRASSDIVGASFRRMGYHVLKILISLVDDEIQRRIVFYEPQPQRTQQKQQVDPHDADTAMVDNTTSGGGDQRMGEEQKPSNSACSSRDNSRAGSPSSVTHHHHQQQQQQVVIRQGTYEGDTLLKKATKIVGHFARVGTNTRDLAHFPGLLGNFIRLITLKPYDCIPWEARLSSLWTVANLACNTENMQLMVCTPGLIDALVEVACRPLHPGDDLETIMELLRSRSIASRAILNLSWAPENKMLLSEHTAVVDLLAELGVHRTAPLLTSRTVRQILVTTRRHAISALRNLAAAPRRTKLGLVQYKKGHLLDVLTDAALNDPDTTVKDHAFAAIHNLAIQDTAQTIVQHPALVLALRGVLSSTEEDESKRHASGTLLVLERTITPEMESSYEILRDLLHAVNPSRNRGRRSRSPSPDNNCIINDGDGGGNIQNQNNVGSSGNDNDGACSELSEVVNATAV